MTTTPALAGPFHNPEHESPLSITSYLDKAAGAVQDAARFAHIKLVTSLTTPENNMLDGNTSSRRLGNFMLHAINKVTESPFGISVAAAACTRIALNTAQVYAQIRHGADLGIHQDAHGNHPQYTLVDYNLDSTSGPEHNSATSEPWPVPRTDKTDNKTVHLEVPAPTYYDNTEDEERSRANGQTVLAGFLCGVVGLGVGVGAGWMMRRNRYMEIARKAQQEREGKSAHGKGSSPAKTKEKVPKELIGRKAGPGDDYPSMSDDSRTVGGFKME